MKKNILVYAAAASMMMLQACTTDEDPSQVWVPGNSEVEIKLSSAGGGSFTEIEEGAPRSRAAIEGNTLNDMGVFCLARSRQNINDEELAIDWTDWSGCVMKNVQSNLEENGKLTWEGQYFYPISQFFAYDFYGYYPRVADENIIMEQYKAAAQFTLTGKEDLIWGRATSTDPTGFSAKFFRKAGNQDALPKLDLKHMLARLIFYVKAGEDVEGTGQITEAQKMTVDSVYIVGAKQHVNLNWYIGREDATLSLRDQVGADFQLCEQNGDRVTAVTMPDNHTDKKRMGESIMLYPEASYELRVVLKDDKGKPFTTESTLSLKNQPIFEAGKNYNVIITVHGPKEIEATAELNPWVDAGEDTDNNVDL